MTIDASVQTLQGDPKTQHTGPFVRHRGPVTCVVGIPGRRAAVASGYDSAVSYIDLEARTIELMGYHDHLANSITADAEGNRAASCSSDYTIYLWDLERRCLERPLLGHWDDVESFAFVDHNTGVSASRDCRIFVWDLMTGAVRRIIDKHEKDVLSVEVADGKIYSSGDDMTLRQWDLATGELLRTWGPFEQETDTCAIDRLHGRVILGADDGYIRIFDNRSGEAVREIEAHASGIKKVAVSPVTGDILSAAYDQRILIWGAESLTIDVELERRPATWERSLNWSPDGRQILAGTFDGTVLVWDAASGRCLDEIGVDQAVPGNACLNDLAANATGDVVLVSDDGCLRLASLEPGHAALRGTLEPSSGRVLMNAVARNDRRGLVVAGAHDQKVHLFHLGDDGLSDETVVRLDEGPINCIRFANHPGYEDNFFVACYSGAIVRMSAAGEVLAKLRLQDGAVKALRIHPHQPLGVSCSADGEALAWTLEGEVTARYHGHIAIADDIDIDPTGERVATVSRDFTLKVYELATGRLLDSLSLGHRSPKSMLFWDHDTVLVGNYWGELYRFDLASGTVRHLWIAANGLSALARSGEHVMATSYDGSIYLVRPNDLEVQNSLTVMVQKVEKCSAAAELQLM